MFIFVCLSPTNFKECLKTSFIKFEGENVTCYNYLRFDSSYINGPDEIEFWIILQSKLINSQLNSTHSSQLSEEWQWLLVYIYKWRVKKDIWTWGKWNIYHWQFGKWTQTPWLRPLFVTRTSIQCPNLLCDMDIPCDLIMPCAWILTYPINVKETQYLTLQCLN